MQLTTRLSPIALAVAAALPAHSQTADTTALPTITVTASRPMMFDERLATTATLTPQELHEINPQTVPDALRFVPGVSITSNGGVGQPASVSVRGTGSGQSAMFLNGLRISSSTTGTAPWALLPADFIDRVEVYRGPAATVFGSDVIGGAVQFFTPFAFGQNRTRLEVGGGTQETAFGNISTRQRVGDWSIYGGIRYYNTGGSNATTHIAYGHEPDRDGYRNASVIASAARPIGDTGVLNLFAFTAPSTIEYDATPDQPNRNRAQVSAYGANLQGSLTDTLDYTATVGATQDKADFSRSGVSLPASNFETWRYQATGALTQRLALGSVRLTNKYGAEFVRESVNSTTQFPDTTRDTASVSINSTLDYGPHTLLLAVRNDTFSPAAERNVTTWNVGYALQLTEQVRARISHGTAYRLPSFNDLYYPRYGNPNLKPERSRQTEVALDANWTPNVSSTLAVYQNDISDLIQFSSTTWLPVNVANARIRGVELATKWRIQPGTSFTGQVAYNEPRDTDLNTDLRRRPRLTASAALSHQWSERFTTAAFVTVTGRSYEDTRNTQRLDGYTLVGLNASYKFTDRITGTLTANNLFNQRYETALGYPALGRAVYASVAYQF